MAFQTISGGFAGLDRAKRMLVLSRKPGEKILIGDNISITVVRIAPGIVRIGIDAPNGLPILREELTASGKSPVDPHQIEAGLVALPDGRPAGRTEP